MPHKSSETRLDWAMDSLIAARRCALERDELLSALEHIADSAEIGAASREMHQSLRATFGAIANKARAAIAKCKHSPAVPGKGE